MYRNVTWFSVLCLPLNFQFVDSGLSNSVIDACVGCSIKSKERSKIDFSVREWRRSCLLCKFTIVRKIIKTIVDLHIA